MEKEYGIWNGDAVELHELYSTQNAAICGQTSYNGNRCVSLCSNA